MTILTVAAFGLISSFFIGMLFGRGIGFHEGMTFQAMEGIRILKGGE